MYDVGEAAAQAETGDRRLAGLEPNRVHAAAAAQRERGVRLVGLAALFVVALVLFTCAEVSDAVRAPASPGEASPSEARSRRLGASELAGDVLAAGGLLVAAGALVLFVLVRMVQ